MTRNKPRGVLFALTASVCLATAIAGCTPIIDYRGYVPPEDRLQQIRVGGDNRESVRAKLGSPSTIGTFESDTWYYISQREERTAFFKPEVTDRTVVAIAFADSGAVQSVNRYGMEDGRVIDLVDRTTPTRGKELTFVEQIFLNLGRFNELGKGGDLNLPTERGGSVPGGGSY